MAGIQAQIASFFHFFSDPGQPVWSKIAAVFGVALVVGLILLGLRWLSRLPSVIARSICEQPENASGGSGLIYDLARLKVDYDDARQQGLSNIEAMNLATEKTIERSKAKSASRSTDASVPPRS